MQRAVNATSNQCACIPDSPCSVSPRQPSPSLAQALSMCLGVKLLDLRSVAAVTGRYMKDFFGKLKLVEKCWTHAQKPGQDKVYSMGLGI